MEKSHTQIPDLISPQDVSAYRESTVNFYLQAVFFLKACSSHKKKRPPLDHEQNIEVEGISTWKPSHKIPGFPGFGFPILAVFSLSTLFRSPSQSFDKQPISHQT